MATEGFLHRRDSLDPGASQQRWKASSVHDSASRLASHIQLPQDSGYDSLQNPTTQIRLCRVLSPSEHGPLGLTIETQALENAVGQYAALSYAWGNEPSVESITVNGKIMDGSRNALTQNLYTQLYRLQRQGFNQMLWVDALSIDQTDAGEKADQVALMARIFTEARTVIIGIDEEARCFARAETEHAFIRATIEELARGMHFRNLTLFSSRTPTNTQDPCAEQVLCRFLNSAWFTRVWVVQEVCLAKDSQLLLADGLLPWGTLEAASQQWNVHLKSRCCSSVVELMEPELAEAFQLVCRSTRPCLSLCRGSG